MTNIQDSQDEGIISYGAPDLPQAGTQKQPASNQQSGAPYQSVDELLTGITPGTQQAATQALRQYSSADELLSGVSTPGGPPAWERNLHTFRVRLDNIENAFIGGTAQAATEDLGLSQETNDWLGKVGIFNDYKNGQTSFLQSLNEAIIKPLAAGVDMAFRIPVAPFEGIAQALEASDNQTLVRAAREARLAPNLLMEHLNLPPDIATARSNATIGEGEAGFMGTSKPTDQELLAREQATTQAPQPQDIHAAARSLAPDTFDEYDALNEQKQLLGNHMRELTANRPAEIQAAAPHTAEIADLQSRIENENLSDRKLQRLQDRLGDLTDKNNAWIEEETGKPSDEQENVRQAYESVDARMRDLSPAVSKAYRDAQQLIPQTETVEPEKSVIPQQRTATQDEMFNNISEDVSKKLVAAGRPQEEAEAAGAIVASHYEARSARFSGEYGTAQEMYERDAPQILGAQRKVKAREFAQQEGLDELMAPLRAAVEKASSLVKNSQDLGDGKTVASGIVKDKDTFEYQKSGQSKEALFAKAEKSKTAYEKWIKELTDGINGAKPYSEGEGGKSGVRVKHKAGRIDEKIAEKNGDASAVSDYLGGAIEVRTPQALQAVLERIGASKKKILEVENMLTSDDKFKDDGYRAIHMQVQISPDFSAELQLLPKDIAKIKEKLHPEYAKLRDADVVDSPKLTAARNKMVNEYDDAFQNFIGKNTLYQSTEKTPAGEQQVIPGAEKISDRELAERKMQGGLKAKVTQKAADEGLFGEGHKQGELFQLSSPRFQHWFGDSKIVDADGNPIVVYHGTNQSFANFDIKRGGASTKNSAAEGGFWFSASKEVASEYASHAARRVPSDISEYEAKLTKLQENLIKAEKARDWNKYEALTIELENHELNAIREGEVGANVLPVYLSIQNPYIVDASEWKTLTEAANIISKAKKAGNDGVIFKNAADSPDTNTVTDHYVAFKPEQIKSAIGNRGEFDANDARILEQTTRGKIRLATADAKAIIKLFQNSNASTFIHEMGHHWLDELLRDADHEKAPADLKQDAATIRKWLGADDEITTAQHERFARSFERYMMEGVAPSPRLAGIFAKFKEWLTNIYKSVKNLRAPITDDVRNVFDRLLTEKPQRTVIAPEREIGRLFSDIHEGDVEATQPEKAPIQADIVKNERRKVTETIIPEDYHDITRGTTAEVEVGTTGGTEPYRYGNAPEPNSEEAGTVQEPAPLGVGGNQVAADSNKSPAKTKRGGKVEEPDFLEKLPDKPLSLSEWISKQGGIKDTMGEVSALGANEWHLGSNGKPIPFRKKLIQAKGMDTDTAALRAWEAGYFPENGVYEDNNPSRRPTVNQLLDKLREDISGKEQYSVHDSVKLEEYKGVMARNNDAEEIADRLGIKTQGLTHDEFWAKVREQMSIEEQAKIAADKEAESVAIYEEAERQAKEFLETRGDSWEPEQINTRTLEDLENERKQEIASRQPFQSDESAGTGGIAGGSEGKTEAVGGQGGRGTGTRPGTGGATERPSDRSPTGSADTSDIIDENGNPKYDLIEKRIEKINTPDDVDNFIRDAARNNDAFSEARRGVVSHAQTFALAEAMGVDGNFYSLVQTRKVGEAYNAHQLKAAEALFKTLAIDAHNKSLLPRTPENIAAFEAANQKFLMATSHFMAAASEAGRALNILRTMSEGLKQAEDIQEFFQRNTGKTAADIAKQMDFMSKLDDQANQAAFIQATKKPTFRDMMLEYYINALLSGPITHTRYMIGNAIKAIETPLVEIPLAAAHGAIREALGKDVQDRVYFGEAFRQLYALGRGSTEGLRAAATAWKTGQSPFLPGEIVKNYRPNAIPGKVGDVLNVPSNAIEAIHGFSKTVRYTQNIAGLAYRNAMREALEGDAFERRVAELTKTPTDEMMTAATKDALKELYMAPADYNSLSGALIRATNSNMAAKIVVPFMKIGSQITREAFIERTPLGLLSQNIRDNISGKNGGAAQDMQMGKIFTGTALIAATATMVAEENATGDGPSDPKQRQEWLLTHRPNSFRVGDVWVPYQGLGSLGMLMRFAANVTETAAHWNDEEGGKLAMSFIEGISKSVLDDNWMRGVKDALDAVYHPEEYGNKYLQNMATNWLPFSVGLGQVSRFVDTDQRLIRSHGMENGFGLMDAIKSRIPYISEGLLPRRDVFGQPILNSGKNYVGDPVVARLDALKIFPSPLQRKIRGVQLTDDQYDDYSRTAGMAVKMRLDRLVQQPGFDQLPPRSQIELINTNIKDYREQARNSMLMKYPEILRQAQQQKRLDQSGGLH